MQNTQVAFPSQDELDAAAKALIIEGGQHGWWPEGTDFEKLDVIERTMFQNIVERVLVIAAAARSR